MALFQKNILASGGRTGIWKIEEDESFFLERLHLAEAEQLEYQAIGGHRRLEWLATRYLLHELENENPELQRLPIIKDAFGKPHFGPMLDSGEGWHISVSHSREFAAAAISPVPVGIDIQKMVLKIHAIARKFMREEEFASLENGSELEHLHVYWGAKEALYKAYGRRQLDFRQHILVAPFSLESPFGRTKATIQKEGFLANYDLTYEQIGNFFMVWCEEELGNWGIKELVGTPSHPIP